MCLETDFLILGQVQNALLGRKLHTIYKDYRFFYRMLVVELRVKQCLVDEGAKVCALIPANMQVVNIHMSQMPHHLHLVGNCQQNIEKEFYVLPCKALFSLTLWFKGLQIPKCFILN